jgi:hypothetical protein
MSDDSMVRQTNNLTFPNHFEGKRFNRDALQARGFLGAFRWKLTSRPEPSPVFISDVQQSIPPRNSESRWAQNHSGEPLDRAPSWGGGINILTDPIWSERAIPPSAIDKVLVETTARRSTIFKQIAVSKCAIELPVEDRCASRSLST